jgi:hypothetical protein
MTILLPLIALALAVLDFVFRPKDRESTRPPAARILALLAVLVVAVGLTVKYGPAADTLGLVTGLVAGAIVALVGELLGGSVAALAMGVAGASALHLLKAPVLPAAQLALVGGAALGAIALGSGGLVQGAATATLVAAMCAAGDFLGARQSDAPAAAIVGSFIGAAGVVGAFASAFLVARYRAVHPILVAVVTVAGAWIATRPIGDSPLLVVTAIGSVAGLVVYFLLPDEEADAVRLGLGTVIAIGVATIAFGLGRGAGMGVALVAMALPLLATGNFRAVLTLGPLLTLVLYRLLREEHPDLSRALDIGQHYAMLGIVLGAVLPLLPSDWLRRGGLKAALGAFLWGLLALGIPALLTVMLGSKGAVGFVVGLGLSGLCQVLRGDRSLQPLAIAAGFSTITILLMGWLRDAIELSRDEKVRIFAYAGGGLLLMAALLALLSRPARTEVVTTEVAP